MLSGLDDVGWTELSHAYGDAAATPVLLRLVASPDEETASDAVSQLHGSIFHQGTVYPATVAAVPFLTELARQAPHQRGELLWMLGMLADDRHAYGASFADVRAAVVGQRDTFAVLLHDAEPAVREAAAYAATMAGTDASALRNRWDDEGDPAVRASLALALGRVDPDAGPLLDDAVLRGEPAVRAAAAIALLRSGRGWPEGTIGAVVEAMDDGATVHSCWSRGDDWYNELIEETADPIALDLLRGLIRAREGTTRTAGIWAAVGRNNARRSAPATVLPVVMAAADDPDEAVRGAVISALRQAGAAAAGYADRLAGLAERYPAVANATIRTGEFHAVQTLVRLGDPRWVDPACAAAADGASLGLLLSGAAFSTAALARVRERLAAEPARADILATVIGGWGADARPAVPELLAALPYAGRQVAGALLAVGHDDPAAVPHLRTRAAETGDLRAALAVHRLTGDGQPLADALRTLLTRRQLRLESVPDVSPLRPVLHPLLPQARVHLTGTPAPTYPQREAQILAARIVAAVEGPDPVLSTVRAVLVDGNTPAATAADLIADLARTHPAQVADFEGPLRDRLGDRWNRLSSARALARLGVPTAELADALVRGVTDYAGRFGIGIILELHAVETVPGLRALVDRDERLGMTGAADDTVWADELLQSRIRKAIAALQE